jgi:DNA-binding NarL/FixJ family response regulator
MSQAKRPKDSCSESCLAYNPIMERLTILTRELTPFEHLVASHLCDGLSNAAVARETAHTEKVVENTALFTPYRIVPIRYDQH